MIRKYLSIFLLLTSGFDSAADGLSDLFVSNVQGVASGKMGAMTAVKFTKMFYERSGTLPIKELSEKVVEYISFGKIKEGNGTVPPSKINQYFVSNIPADEKGLTIYFETFLAAAKGGAKLSEGFKKNFESKKDAFGKTVPMMIQNHIKAAMVYSALAEQLSNLLNNIGNQEIQWSWSSFFNKVNSKYKISLNSNGIRSKWEKLGFSPMQVAKKYFKLESNLEPEFSGTGSQTTSSKPTLSFETQQSINKLADLESKLPHTKVRLQAIIDFTKENPEFYKDNNLSFEWLLKDAQKALNNPEWYLSTFYSKLNDLVFRISFFETSKDMKSSFKNYSSSYSWSKSSIDENEKRKREERKKKTDKEREEERQSRYKNKSTFGGSSSSSNTYGGSYSSGSNSMWGEELIDGMSRRYFFRQSVEPALTFFGISVNDQEKAKELDKGVREALTKKYKKLIRENHPDPVQDDQSKATQKREMTSKINMHYMAIKRYYKETGEDLTN